ncbi:MAG TPA: PilZ domain-containing protein [Vulgatibacter sp.]|nr:PilZ domain-containing protein [Vulgatibacter sp.]
MAQVTGERRSSSRFDKAFPVYVTTPQGIFRGVARNISSGGMFIETRDLQPMGGRITVCFADHASGVEISVVSEVRFQCVLEYGGKEGPTALRGVGVRFLEFDTGFDLVAPGPPPSTSMH